MGLYKGDTGFFGGGKVGYGALEGGRVGRYRGLAGVYRSLQLEYGVYRLCRGFWGGIWG